MNNQAPLSSTDSNAPPADRMELYFFIFVSLLLAGMAAWVIYVTPALRELAHAVPFALVMLLHIGLYWASLPLGENPTRVLPYLAVQGLLASAAALLGRHILLTFGPFMGLIGLAVGMLRQTRLRFLATGLLVGLSFLSYGVLSGWQGLGWWLLGTAPALIFVVLYVTLYNRQARQRIHAQQMAAELEAANRALAEHAGTVAALTLSNERQRLARELHDTLSQGLAGLILQLEAAQAHLTAGRTERARAIIADAMLQARAALADSRRAIDDLRRAQDDLETALRQEAERFSTATGLPCTLDLDLPTPVPPPLREPVQRTLAEALTNVARHARATQVQVTLKSGPTGLTLTVRDDGAGFDPLAAPRPGHYGLLGIRERALLAGGEFHVRSTPGQGTVVAVSLPYRESPQPARYTP